MQKHPVYHSVATPMMLMVIPLLSVTLDYFIAILMLFLACFLLAALGFPLPIYASVICCAGLYVWGVFMTRKDPRWFLLVYAHLFYQPHIFLRKVRYVC